MAKVKSFKAEFGASAEIKGIWYKFYAGIELEIEPGDNTEEVKQKAWNTVIHEVEKQMAELVNND